MVKICSVNDKHIFHDNSFAFCPKCAAGLIDSLDPIETEIYLHSSKETMYEKGTDMELSDAAMNEFKYAAYELCLTVKVDPVNTNRDIMISET